MGRIGVKDSKGVWDQHVQPATFQVDNQQGPTYSTGKSAQC